MAQFLAVTERMSVSGQPFNDEPAGLQIYNFDHVKRLVPSEHGTVVHWIDGDTSLVIENLNTLNTRMKARDD